LDQAQRNQNTEPSKAAVVRALLRLEGGATLNEIMNATGWKACSCRSFLTSQRKHRRYKLSLADFAKIVDVLDTAKASFVSITQSFNTTTSMGRLTLNMLLSFAQFEREVTGERIRDKIAASKRKGMWMGGPLPLGYDVENRRLVVNPKEAELVRQIYQRYLELGSVVELADDLNAKGYTTKVQLRASGPHRGGCAFRRGTLYHLLANPIYRGQIVHIRDHGCLSCRGRNNRQRARYWHCRRQGDLQLHA